MQPFQGIAKDLLLSGANPSKAGFEGWFPIHFAAHHGLDEVVVSLFHKGIDPTCVTTREETHLLLAVKRNHVAIINALLAEGADVNFLTTRRPVPLAHIAALHNNAAAMPALFKAGVYIEGRSPKGRTPLQNAAFCGSCEAMLALLQLGANVNSKNTINGLSPLCSACREGHHDAADLLLRWGADETAVDSDEKTIVSMMTHRIFRAAVASRQRLERVSELLARAPQDRAWRRRGFLVPCLSHPDRVQLAVEIPEAATEAIEQTQERPRRHARTGQVEVKVEMDGTNGGGGGAGAKSGAREGTESMREGTDGGFNGLSAWMIALTEEHLFRKIMGFL
ncbi:unnamed protein product [Ectocarpus sp. CCAP 1310/34]|nr:unnamed protein product [Ectocarpus sp. CCAP 1310/34]